MTAITMYEPISQNKSDEWKLWRDALVLIAGIWGAVIVVKALIAALGQILLTLGFFWVLLNAAR